MNVGMLTLQEYQREARLTDKKPDDMPIVALGLFGEIGSLMSEVKKKQRDSISYKGYSDAVIEEFGDVLWYLVSVASRSGLEIAHIAATLNDTPSDKHTQSTDPLLFSNLQDKPERISDEPTPEFERTLMILASSVGKFINDVENGVCRQNAGVVAGHLFKILKSLIAASNESGVTLEIAARHNLEKIFGRWPNVKIFPEPFDTHAPSFERFPKFLAIDIEEKTVNDKTFVFQRCNGITIGDRLTDNIQTPDDYRFHDVFHYAHTAVLGWSPVTRALFKLKRKSHPKTDEAEDGARAILLEEGITAWIFNQSKLLNYFEGFRQGDLSFNLLKTIRKFVEGYEVDKCPLWVWEEAILQGYEAFRYLKLNREGRVTISLPNRRLSVGPIPDH